MTSRLMVVEHLVDANRALETLRDELTKARVRVESQAKLLDRAGEDPAPLWDLGRRIEKMRELVYAEELDAEMLSLVRDAAVAQ